MGMFFCQLKSEKIVRPLCKGFQNLTNLTLIIMCFYGVGAGQGKDSGAVAQSEMPAQ